MQDDTPYLSAGQRIGLWTLLESAPLATRGVLCRCDCGTERLVHPVNLARGHSKSCGCRQRAERAKLPPYIPKGTRFEMLVTLEDATSSNSPVRCRCDCGKERLLSRAIQLTKSRYPSRSCGCRMSKKGAAAIRAAKATHGLSNHPIYGLWVGIVARTSKPTDFAYKWYGARGIRIYEPWRTDPTPFIEWITENLGPRPEGCSLDRIDNDGDYEPGNLRWATQLVQARNKRSIWRLTQERDALRAQLAAVMQSVKHRSTRHAEPRQDETLF